MTKATARMTAMTTTMRRTRRRTLCVRGWRSGERRDANVTLLDHDQHRVGLDRHALADTHRRHGPLTRRAQLVLHLHRLDDNESLVGGNPVSRLHEYFDDPARHRRDHIPGAGATGRARRARPAISIQERHPDEPAVDVDELIALVTRLQHDLITATTARI